MSENKMEEEYKLITEDNTSEEELLEYYKCLYSLNPENKEEIQEIINELEKDK